VALAGTFDARLRFAEAQQLYREALALEPSNANARLWFAHSLLFFRPHRGIGG
jgi:hypothetical protein